MPDPTPDPDEFRTEDSDRTPAGDSDRTPADNPAGTQDQDPAGGTAEGSGPPEEASPEGLTVDDILSTPQSDDAESSAQGAPEGEDPAAALAEQRLEELRRLQAEFVNFKHRTAREKEQLRGFVTGDLLQALLPVFDDIDAARQAGDLTEGPFAAIATKLEDVLVRQGLERIGAVGEKFDPNVHEAVLQQPTSEVEPDQVSMVLRSGFRIGERVVRPAQVAVAVAE